MEQIIQPNENILGILGKAKYSDSGYRFSHYCVSAEHPDGVLLWHTLTRELLLLTPEEFANALSLQELRERRFVVAQELDEKKLAKLVQWVLKTTRRKEDFISDYTILTTTDCNARCFYCYELGRSRIPMSAQTALKTAEFIRSHCGGKPVRITWFGGEPLYNASVIDIISDYLRENGVEFSAFMISNGYLYNDEMVEKAHSRWNITRVQITLDGTEDVYNRCKAFIYRGTSAYQVVTGNIERLLNKGIDVNVRMNMDFHNAQDLKNLSQELADRFGGYSGFRAYSHLIFDENTPWDQRYSLDKWTALYQAREELEQCLAQLGLSAAGRSRLRRTLSTNQCMADDDHSIVITPNGDLGVCEHFSESEFIGNLDSEQRDQAVIQSFCQRCDEIPECDTCFYYPQCVRLKKCPDLIPCIQPERDNLRKKIHTAMINEYNIHKAGNTEQSSETDEQDMT